LVSMETAVAKNGNFGSRGLVTCDDPLCPSISMETAVAKCLANWSAKAIVFASGTITCDTFVLGSQGKGGARPFSEAAKTKL
jgi:hypothetical protein